MIKTGRSMAMEKRVEIIEGDITKQEVDAIVNAANTSLLGGGGVDGAIHRAAGPELLEETKKIGGCPTGEARASKGYRLPAKWVIHTVGPVWSGGNRNEEKLLAGCYGNCYRVARELGVESIAFPSISTGAYRFPLERATEIALEETKKVLEKDKGFTRVLFVCFGEKVLKTYQDLFKRVF
jgi:O-acetyl-ADP-ribose deacetylase (regulator of RNase III)